MSFFLPAITHRNSHRPVEEIDQRSHKEGGDDRTYADRTEDLLKALPRDKKQRNACRHADKIANHPAEREFDLALPL